MTSAALPLQGIRVLELGRLLAAPLAAQMLGDMGAEVIKIERAGRGDEFRHYGPPFMHDKQGRRTDQSASFASTNRNKRGMTIDFAKPEGREIILELARQSDVFIENFKTGSLAHYGLDYDAINAVNPDIIYLSVTGFGQTGPYAQRPGTDGAFQAMCGLMAVTGEPAGAPQKAGTFIVDFVTGLFGTIAVLSALRHREINQGGGQAIDLALLDCSLAAMAMRASEYFVDGKEPDRVGNRTPGSAPSQIFSCSDGDLVIQAGFEDAYRNLCRVVGRPDLAVDPRFATRDNRVVHIDALEPELNAALSKQSVAHWFAELSAAGVICAPIYAPGEAFDDPHVVARGVRVRIPHPDTGTLDVVANPIRFSKTPIETYTAPPKLGEGNADILADLLGYAPDRIARLAAEGIL
ncbi:MAG: CoA transferase [Sphingopyxis macrogoltabida]|uniref:CoA transferase n=1 Tax=Sphingopyxis macrogoltabida TaxID=33050 RepID=A0A2W5L2Q0_SPHMC|nr:MAG: CoA transferase [Sphingopyxis macrogoltabida]